MNHNLPDELRKHQHMLLKDKVCVIVGASSLRSIGYAVAELFAAHAAKLGIVDLTMDKKIADDITSSIAAQTGRAPDLLGVQCDIRSTTDCDRAIAAAVSRFGTIDCMVNCAAIVKAQGMLAITEADYDRILDVNLKGTFFISQAVAKLMMGQGGGRIINISSQAGSVALKGESVYCMSKAAINHLTRCLAYEWAPYQITVNSVAPTFIRTDGTRPALSDPKFHAHVLDHIPLGRIGETSDVTGAVVFLASPAADLVTGANILVDGGWSVA